MIQPGMGTEHTRLVLAAFINLLRPTSCIEIGAGDSTVAIAKALVAAKESQVADLRAMESKQYTQRASLLHPHFATQPYNPRFVSIDNFSVEACSATVAWEYVQNNLADKLSFESINSNFFELPDSFYDQYTSFDFVWLDAGSITDDVMFIAKLWEKISLGGLLFLHEAYITAHVTTKGQSQLSMVRSPLWEKII